MSVPDAKTAEVRDLNNMEVVGICSGQRAASDMDLLRQDLTLFV